MVINQIGKQLVFVTSILIGSTSWSSDSTLPEHITFESAGRPEGQPMVLIPAELHLPSSDNSSFPAVVLVHGSGGMGDRERWYAKEFTARGYAAIIIDSFKPRGVTSTVANQSAVPEQYMIRDAFGALQYLAKNKKIDTSRIGVMGFSKGGIVALRSSLQIVTNRSNQAQGTTLNFAFHIPFYPGCNIQHRNTSTTGKPVLVMLGELDDYTPPKPCIEYVERLKEGNTRVEYHVVAGAYHGWENGTGPYYLGQAETIRHCVYFVEDDGSPTLVRDKEGKSISPLPIPKHEALSHYQNECRVYGGTVYGGTPEMRRKALEEVFAFLKKHGLP